MATNLEAKLANLHTAFLFILLVFQNGLEDSKAG